MSKKEVLMRVVLNYTNPTKKDMLHLTNTIFTGKATLWHNSMTISHEIHKPLYCSTAWLHNLQAAHTLSMEEWSNTAYLTILAKNKRGY